MKIRKTYEAIINLSATEMYSGIDAVILDKLKKNFEGRCKEGSFLINIISITKRSSCKISKSHLDGSGTVNVQYLAEAVTFHKGDILSVCEIIRIEKNHKILCKYDNYTIVWIKGNRSLQSLRPGQKIPVLVSYVSYGKSQDKIVVYGVPYTYPNRFSVFILSDATSSMMYEDVEILKMKMDELSYELDLYNKTDMKIRQFLSDIYYPYKKKVLNFSKEIKMLSIEKIDKINMEEGTLLFRHQLINKSTDSVMMLPSFQDTLKEFDSQLYKFEIVHESPIRALLFMIDDYVKFIRLIRELATTFNTEKLLESQNNIWTIYRNIKKD